MLFTVAHIHGPIQVTYDPINQELRVIYQNPHRAAQGRQLQVLFDESALKVLVDEIRCLEGQI